MDKREFKNYLLWGLIVLVILLVADIIDYRSSLKRRIEAIERSPKAPAPDPSMGTPLFYSIERSTWIYSDGAKAINDASQPTVDMDKYLKEKLPIYKKKTYWGEEWDKPDIIWDDEGDDDEQEDGPKK